MAFDGFGPATFAWFAGLEAENTREWFHAHRAEYDAAVRGPFEDLLDELALPDEDVRVARQHRDTRFSKDKRRTRPAPTAGSRRAGCSWRSPGPGCSRGPGTTC